MQNFVTSCTGGNESQWNVSQAGQQIAGWILQQYASLGFRRALTQTDVAALESRVRAGAASPALDPRSWEDFQSWFSKTIKALKQVCHAHAWSSPSALISTLQSTLQPCSATTLSHSDLCFGFSANVMRA